MRAITDLSQLPTSIASYLIYVVPELKINGLTVKTGKPMRLGEELPLATAVNFAGRGVLQMQCSKVDSHKRL